MNNGKVSAFLLSVMLCALLVSACGKPEAPAETHPTPEATQPISSTESDSSKSEQEQDETAAAPVIPETQPVTDEQTVPGVAIHPTEGGTEFTEGDNSVGSTDGNTSSAPVGGSTSSGSSEGNTASGSEGEVAPVEPSPAPQPGETTKPNQTETAPANPVVTPTEPIVPGEIITDPAEPETTPMPEVVPEEMPTESTVDPEEPTQSPDLEDYELPLVPAF